MKNAIEAKKMLPELISYFEKNILLKLDERERVLLSEKSKIVDYLKTVHSIAKKEYEDSEIAFKKVMDSKPVQAIFDSLCYSVMDNQIAFRVISNTKFFEGFGDERIGDIKDLFSAEELVYFVTNKVPKSISKKEDGQTWQEILIEHLDKDRTCLNLPFSPVVFKICGDDLEQFVIDNMSFSVPSEMDILEYFDRTFGMINRLPKEKIKSGLLEYIEQGNNVIRGFYQLSYEYSGEPLGYKYDGFKQNDLSLNNIMPVLNEIFIEKGLDNLLNLKSDEEKSMLIHLIPSLINVDLIDKSNPKFTKFIVEINKKEREYNFDYQLIMNDKIIPHLIKAVKNGDLDSIYLSTNYYATGFSIESIKLIKENISIFNLIEDVKESWDKVLNKDYEAVSEDFDKFKNRCTGEADFILNMIFSDKIDSSYRSALPIEDAEKNQVEVVKFYQSNPHLFTEKMMKRGKEEVSMLINISEEGILKLIELEKNL